MDEPANASPRAATAGAPSLPHPAWRKRHVPSSWTHPNGSPPRSTIYIAVSRLAQRDPGSVDIAFSTGAGGHIWSDDFNAEAHLAGIEELAALGVTWLQVGLPGDSLGHVTEAIERYGKQVIAVCA